MRPLPLPLHVSSVKSGYPVATPCDVGEYTANVPNPACPAVIDFQQASDAHLDKNGETAAHPNCGVGAADCLVGSFKRPSKRDAHRVDALCVAWRSFAVYMEQLSLQVAVKMRRSLPTG